jgi:tRNA(Arg) A34 adenosine deaminase TadA
MKKQYDLAKLKKRPGKVKSDSTAANVAQRGVFNALSDRVKSAGRSKTDPHWLLAIQEAIGAGLQGNYPAGAAIADSKFKIVSIGRNSVFKPNFRSDAHAEMNALNKFETANGRIKSEGLTLYSTLEPCLMCTARILLSNISGLFIFTEMKWPVYVITFSTPFQQTIVISPIGLNLFNTQKIRSLRILLGSFTGLVKSFGTANISFNRRSPNNLSRLSGFFHQLPDSLRHRIRALA